MLLIRFRFRESLSPPLWVWKILNSSVFCPFTLQSSFLSHFLIELYYHEIWLKLHGFSELFYSRNVFPLEPMNFRLVSLLIAIDHSVQKIWLQEGVSRKREAQMETLWWMGGKKSSSFDHVVPDIASQRRDCSGQKSSRVHLVGTVPDTVFCQILELEGVVRTALWES